MKQKIKTKPFPTAEKAIQFLVQNKISRNDLIDSYWKNKKYVIEYIKRSK